LLPMDVAVWKKWVLVRLEPGGAALDAIPALDAARFHWFERRLYHLECNWKVFVDNYLDGGYHVPHLHKSLDSILDYADYRIEIGERFCLQSSPVEIVIDEDFPVAFEMVQPPLEPVKTRSVKGGTRVKSGATRFQPDEYPFLPDGNIHRQKAHRPAVEIHNGAHIGCAFQLTFERVGPAVVRAS